MRLGSDAPDAGALEVLTFDCYGTLIDWETGIVEALRPLVRRAQPGMTDGEILERYARAEARLEREAYARYRDVLRRAVEEVTGSLGLLIDEGEADVLAESMPRWRPFPDTVGALEKLASRYRLGVITNTDDDLFAGTAEQLGVRFDWVVTAGQVGSYKPSLRNFQAALERIARPKEVMLHVAQSLYHDIAPAKRLGIRSVWVNRRGDRAGSGATPPVEVRPDLEVTDLEGLVSILGPDGRP